MSTFFTRPAIAGALIITAGLGATYAAAHAVDQAEATIAAAVAPIVRIDAPAPAPSPRKVAVPARYREAVDQAAARHGIRPGFLAAVIERESRWDPKVCSEAGACGIAQFMPKTAKEYGVKRFDAKSSIDGAARYLAHLQGRFGSEAKAAAAYNWGPTNLRAWLEGGARIMPEETRAYVQAIASESPAAWRGRLQVAAN